MLSIKKYMKKIFYIAVSFSFFSCSTYTAMMSEKTNVNTTHKLFFSDENMSKIEIELNGKEYNFIFDTGAGNATTIYDLKQEVDSSKIIRSRKIYGYDQSQNVTSTEYIIDTLKTAIFESKNKFTYLINRTLDTYCSIGKADGVIGVYAVMESNFPLFLNYEDGYISFLEDEYLNRLQGYSEVNARFNQITGMIMIELSINDKNYFYTFDTGNFTTIIGSDLVTAKENYSLDLLVENVGHQSKTETYHIFKNSSIKLGDYNLYFDYSNIENLNKKILSHAFIKNFNWIIDYKNKKMYFKPIGDSLFSKKEISSKPRILNFSEKNGKIYILSVLKNETEYKPGQIISSVGGIKITHNNLCQTLKMLNETENWSNLNIEIEK